MTEIIRDPGTVSADNVRAWVWQSPEEIVAGITPGVRWWNDNARFPSAIRSLTEHLARNDWNGWRILADLKDGRSVALARALADVAPSGAAAKERQKSSQDEPKNSPGIASNTENPS